MTSRTAEIEQVLQDGRTEVIAFMRKNWLENLWEHDKPFCEYLTFERISTELNDEWKVRHLRDGAARHAMRRARALGLIRWGLVILTTKVRFGDEATDGVIKRLFPYDDPDGPTLQDILPVAQFGRDPLGIAA